MSWVLVVDDNEAIRDCLVGLLEDLGVGAMEAKDGVEAVAHLRKASTPPMLVLLDLMMPRMNGWQFLDLRSREPALAAVPVAVMTAMKDMTIHQFDVLKVLEKPIEYDTLRALVERAMPRHPAAVT
ncbi:MAG: response regulator [Myxococcaceae bacterium]|nr:response regulator [Myxococcaceae bacterium]